MSVTLYERLESFYRAKSYRWEAEAYRVNLCFLRGESVGKWDDLACMAYTDVNGLPQVLTVAVTTDASEEEWTRPTHPDGCVYVRDGQYLGGLAPGLHKGRHALRQQVPYHCVRWTGGHVPTPDELEALGPYSFWGNQGTHWHNRYSDDEPPQPKRGDSQGCTVSLRRVDHAIAMELVEMQGERTGSYVVSPVYARMREVLP